MDMLLLQKKKHGIHFYTVWFAEKPLKKKGVISYREYIGEDYEQSGTEFDTLVSDLTKSEEEIKQQFSKNCRYYVNRAVRENIDVKMYAGKEISDEMILAFLDFFEEFWESKGSSLGNKDAWYQEFKVYRDQGALGITEAYVNGQKSVYHTHILTPQRVRLWHSASLYRLQEEDAATKNLIGIANRYLHYQEMLYYKSLGKTVYDWGGAGMGEDVIHITEFKRSFGGTPVTYRDFEQVNGLAARFFKLAVKVLRK